MIVLSVQRRRRRVCIRERDGRHGDGIALIGIVSRRRHRLRQRCPAIRIRKLIHEVAVSAILNFEFLLLVQKCKIWI